MISHAIFTVCMLRLAEVVSHIFLLLPSCTLLHELIAAPFINLFSPYSQRFLQPFIDSQSKDTDCAGEEKCLISVIVALNLS